MSGFTADPDALRRLAKLLERAQEDIHAGKNYIGQFKDLEHGEGQLDEGAHEETINTLCDWFSEVADRSFGTTAEAISRAADYYETTDHQIAAEYDQLEIGETPPRQRLDGWESGQIIPSRGADFDDRNDAQRELKPVNDTGLEIEMLAEYNWTSVLSISDHLGVIVRTATEVLATIGVLDRSYDPWDEMFRPYSGDWAGIQATSEGFRCLSRSLETIRDNVTVAANGIDKPNWDGNAADSVRASLHELGNVINGATVPLQELADSYEKTAQDMTAHRDACVGLYKELLNSAAEIALAASVASGSTSTGFGAPVGGIAGLYGLYKGYKVFQYIKKILDISSKAQLAMSVWRGVNTEFSRIDGQVALPKAASLQATLPG